MFDFKVEILTTDDYRSHIRYILKYGKAYIEEEAPTSYIGYSEDISVFGNQFVIVAKNVPLEMFGNIKDWFSDIRKSLAVA